MNYPETKHKSVHLEDAAKFPGFSKSAKNLGFKRKEKRFTKVQTPEE